MWTKDQKMEDESKLSSKNESFIQKIKATFDLDLLKNSTYLNVSLGCSLYYVTESNFKLMMPFFLSDIGECILILNQYIKKAKDVYYSVNEWNIYVLQTHGDWNYKLFTSHINLCQCHWSNIVESSINTHWKTHIFAIALCRNYINCS